MHTQITGMNLAAMMQQTMAAAMVASAADPASAYAVTPPDAGAASPSVTPDPPPQTRTPQVDVKL